MEEALIKRVMPHSIEAEQSVVGAMLMDKDAITTAGEIISGDDFYQASYGVIFDSMIELFNEGKPVDLITLQERLKEKDVPAEIASLEFVRDLVTAVPTSANVKYYAQIVADKSVMRKMIKLNEEIENMINLAKRLRVKGAFLVSVTRMSNNPLSACCDENLYIESVHAEVGEYGDYESTTPYFILIELLYLAYQNYLAGKSDKNEER